MRRIFYSLLTVIVVAFCGCSSGNDSSTILDASGKHPSGWVVQSSGGEHPGFYFTQSESCVQCHGSDLRGGVSEVSCFSSSFNGLTCHPGGPGHPVGWSAPDQHGSHAKAAPVGSDGMAFCTNCHGSSYDGAGSQRLSCFRCHSNSAPHPAAAIWRSSQPAIIPYTTSGTHTDTNTGNAPACSQCHNASTKNLAQPYLDRFVPAGSFNGTAAGCFNGSMCHAEITRTTNCNVCHGTSSGAFNSLNGITTPTNANVGAHSKHLGSSISAPVACQECHPVPATYQQGGLHRDGSTNISFGALATNDGTLTPSVTGAFTCNNIYCHGVTIDLDGRSSNPNLVALPTWNVPFPAATVAQRCGSCHGYPPSPPDHPIVPSSGCSVCHDEVNSSGDGFTPTGIFLHIDGSVETTDGTPHPVPFFAHNSAASSSCLDGLGGCHAVGSAASLYPRDRPDCMSCHTLADPLLPGNGLGNCRSCHGTGGTGTLAAPTGSTWPDIRGSNTDARHPSHEGSVCGSCHPGVDSTGRSIIPGGDSGYGSRANHGPNKDRVSGGVQTNIANTVTGIVPNIPRGTGSTCTHSSLPNNSCHEGPSGTRIWSAP